MKYIISSGTSVISATYFGMDSFSIEVTDNFTKAFSLNTYGDAMKECIKVNNLIGKDIFKVMPIE